MPKRLGSAWLYTAKIKPTPRKQIVLFRAHLCRAVLYCAPQRRILTPLGRALAATSRCVLSLRLKSLRQSRLDHLSDKFFFKFFINFRPRVFVFARQLVVKFRHIAAAFAVELDRVSPYGAVF